MPKILKYYIFPFVLILLVIVLASFHIHGSSIGEFHKILYGQEYDDPYLLFGKSRGIRSDEWMSGTPQLLSQYNNDFPEVNKDIADGVNLAYSYGAPTDSIFTIFKPNQWIFFLVNNIEFSFSFYWWFKIALLMISFYLLLLELTKKNLFLSVLGSLLLLFTPFTQWWLGFDPLVMICFGIFFFIKVIREKKLLQQILYGLGFTYSLASFALTLYPPYQVPLAWVALFLGLGIIISEWKELFKDRKTLLKRISIFVLSTGITGIIIFLYFRTFADVVSIMTNTTYPGTRFFFPGGGDIKYLLSGFYDILMQRDSNGAPFSNQSEASSFFMLYPFLTIWALYVNIKNYLKKKSIDWIAISLICGLILLTSWYLLPLPDLFSKITGLYMVLPGRIVIGQGLASYLLMIYMLSTKLYIPNLKHRLDVVLLTIIIGLTAIIYYITGNFLFEINPHFFSWPAIVPPILKIFGVVILTPILVFLFILRKRLGLIILVLFGIVSTIIVNPLYKELDILTETPLAKYIQNTTKSGDDIWAIYGNYAYAHYVLANGGHILNGMHQYPQFGIWKILDKNVEYYAIYNRFAYISLTPSENNEMTVNLAEMDTVSVKINPCGPEMKELDVKYILSTVPMNKECLLEKATFGEATIYEINN